MEWQSVYFSDSCFLFPIEREFCINNNFILMIWTIFHAIAFFKATLGFY